MLLLFYSFFQRSRKDIIALNKTKCDDCQCYIAYTEYIITFNLCFYCAGMILIFQFSPGFGTEASVPAVLVPRFWFLLLDTRALVQGFEGVFAFFSFLYQFGSITVPFPLQIRWNLKLWYGNLNLVESKLLRIFGTKIKKLQFFWYFRFQTNTSLLI